MEVAPPPAEPTPPPAEPTVSAKSETPTIKDIKREQKKEGVDSCLVVFEGDATDAGRWVPTGSLPSDIVAQFREQRKKKTAKPDDQKARKIRTIHGIIPGDDLVFVVRFRDTTKDEAVPRAIMHAQYAKELLKFYEGHMERVPPPQPEKCE